MTNKKLLKTFLENPKEFKKGYDLLKREAELNGFKTTVNGLLCFLDNCEIDLETHNFYSTCILNNK